MGEGKREKKRGETRIKVQSNWNEICCKNKVIFNLLRVGYISVQTSEFGIPC